MQRDALTRAGCTRTYEDRKSGAKAERPDLMLALEVVRAGDQLVVWRLDRLGRSLSDLIGLIRTLDDRGLELRSLPEGIDTSTINGKFTFHLFAALAEFERALIRERTPAGLAAARGRGHRSAVRVGQRDLALTGALQLLEHSLVARLALLQGSDLLGQVLRATATRPMISPAKCRHRNTAINRPLPAAYQYPLPCSGGFCNGALNVTCRLNLGYAALPRTH